MSVNIFNIIYLFIALEATLNLFRNAVWFRPLLDWADKKGTGFDIEKGDIRKGNILADFIKCKYCQSFWGAIFILVLYLFIPCGKYIIYVLVVHRLSNLFHILFDLIIDIRDKKRNEKALYG